MNRSIPRLLAALAALSSLPVQAGNFMVNDDGDAPDALAGDNVCDVLPPGDPAPAVCTLRAAIMQANANTDASTVWIPPGFHIVLSGALPQIVHPLDIAGMSAADVADLAVIDGDESVRPFSVLTTDVALRNLRIVNGRTDIAGSGGGAVYASALSHVLIENVQFARNSALGNALGGGAILSHGSLEVRRSDFEENATNGNGGAIYHTGAGSELLEVRDSSIRRTRTGAITGEAVHVAAGAQLELVNSLIDGSDNQPGATESGGVVGTDAARIELRNATLVNFTRRALQVELDEGSVLRMHNSILAGSDAGDCVVGSAADGVIEFGFNLIEDDTCAIHSGGDVVNGAPGLSLLRVDDGSFVRYRMPLPGGAAVDAASPGPDHACENADQRGTPRPLDDDGDGIARCDLGAVEGTDPLTRVFEVGTSVDSVDLAPGDGLCANSAGACSLRAAVMEANAKPGPDVIRFHPLNMSLTRPQGADAGGGDLDITEALLVEGAFDAQGRPITVIAQTVEGERHFEVNADVEHSVAFRGLRLTGGSTASVSGGSIRITGGAVVDIDRVEFLDNRTEVEGGAVSLVDGYLTVTGSDFHHNQSGSSGAALYVGGSGTAKAIASSFWSNEGYAPMQDSLYVAPGGELELRNSTIAFNRGGVTGHFASSLYIDQSTIAFNESRGIALFFREPGVEHFRLRASVVAGSGLEDCGILNPELGDVVELDAWNLVQDGPECSAGATNVVADPLLSTAAGPSPLSQPQGQLSRVLLPIAGAGGPSPVLDRVPVGASCLGTDQVGQPRPHDLVDVADGDGPCDIGAVELRWTDAIFDDGFDVGD